MTHRIGRAAVLAAALLALTAGIALAHEEREVGDYTFEVGFIDEPVFTGQKSGLEFFVSRGEEPVEGLEETLQAEVTFGSQTRDLEVSPRFGEAGAYESVFFPTAAGPYTFRIYGEVEGYRDRRVLHVQRGGLWRGRGARWRAVPGPVPGNG